MKKLYILLLSLFLLFNSCQDRLEDEFVDPSKYTPDTEMLLPGMFTTSLSQWKFYIKDYGEWWWQMDMGIFHYSQLVQRYVTPRYTWYREYDDVVNGNGFHQDGLNWFSDYYTRLKTWPVMRDELEKLSGQVYDDNIIYFKLLTIVKNWAALRNVDFFNSIPYSEAFGGTLGVLFPKYDDPKEIYISVLDELKTISEELPGIYSAMSGEAKELLSVQDLALKGDVAKWVQYANALRLRYAVKLSGVDEVTASTHIADAITNLPTEDLTWDIVWVNPAADLPGGGTWQRGAFEKAYAMFMTNIILNRMNFHELVYEEGIDDPRLPVLALPTFYNDYRGVSLNADAQEAGYNAGDKYYPYADDITSSSERNSKSMWSHVTFTHNNLPADMFTLGEIDLLLAEVAAKNLVATGKTAGDHIKDAVVHSSEFWYKMNALSEYGMEAPEPWNSLIHPANPGATIFETYGGKVKDAFDAKSDIEDKMEIIMQQKYIHINLLRPYLAWSELRRTRHPKLEPLTLEGVVMAPMVERLKYPSSEFSLNTENYMEVAGQDNWTTPVFWVTDAKKSETYYRDSYVDFKTSELPDFD